jgi:ATP-dependent DNA ligase
LIEFVEGIQTRNIEDVYHEFDKVIQRNEEGIILKKLDSVYEPNERALSWVKLKGDYMEGLTDTFDLLIIGGYFGEGKVRLGVSNYFTLSLSYHIR